MAPGGQRVKAVHSPRWRRARALLTVIGLFLVVYVGTYYRLSRRGMAEAEAAGMPYFFYCPLSDVSPYQNFPRQHRLSLVVFDPLNQLDRTYFGRGMPCRGITWGFAR